jgi:hypothetical protein
MAQLEETFTDPIDSTFYTAYSDRTAELIRADDRFQAARAISDVSFAWKVLQEDVGNRVHEFVPESDSNRTAISKNYALWTKQDEGSLDSIFIGHRIITGGSELELRAVGPRKRDMSLFYYELDDETGEHSEEIPASKLHLPKNTNSQVKFANRALALANFLELPARKRARLQRYDLRHRSMHS